MTGGEEISLAEEEIPSDGGGDGNIDEEKHTLINHDPYQYSPRDLRLQCSNVFWFGLCMLVFSVGLFAVMYHRAYSDAAGEKKLWAFSIDSPGMQLEDTLKHLAGPIMEAVSYEWQQYDSDLIHTQYFGAPSKEHDATWKELWDQGDIGFPYDKLSAINKSKKDYNWWRMPPPDDNQVIAFPEATHQLHCVDLLWHFSWREHWDWSSHWNISELVFKLHTNHCYLALFNMIRCQADVTPVLLQEDASGLGAWKTRDAPHRCKTFVSRSEWQKKHRVCHTDCQIEDVS